MERQFSQDIPRLVVESQKEVRLSFFACERDGHLQGSNTHARFHPNLTARRIEEAINDTCEEAAKYNILYPIPNPHEEIMSTKKVCGSSGSSLENPDAG